MMLQNEIALHGESAVTSYHNGSGKRCGIVCSGLHTEGLLPGPLKVTRRATALRRMLESNNSLSNDPMKIIDWVNMFALAMITKKMRLADE